jgi:hypothetical protein
MPTRHPQINAVITEDIAAQIVARAQAVGISRSRYAALIIEKWKRDGYPAVSEADQALQKAQDNEKRSD